MYYMYSYEQLLATLNQQNAIIHSKAAMIYNPLSERQWLEEHNKIQQEELEKSQKNLADLEMSAKLKEHNLKK